MKRRDSHDGAKKFLNSMDAALTVHPLICAARLAKLVTLRGGQLRPSPVRLLGIFTIIPAH